MTEASGKGVGSSPLRARSALSQRLLEQQQGQPQVAQQPTESVIDIGPLGPSLPNPASLPPLHPGKSSCSIGLMRACHTLCSLEHSSADLTSPCHLHVIFLASGRQCLKVGPPSSSRCILLGTTPAPSNWHEWCRFPSSLALAVRQTP